MAWNYISIFFNFFYKIKNLNQLELKKIEETIKDNW